MNKNSIESSGLTRNSVDRFWQATAAMLVGGALIIGMYADWYTFRDNKNSDIALQTSTSPYLDEATEEENNPQEILEAKIVTIEITTLEQFESLITQGMSTQVYELKISNPELRLQIKEELSHNRFYISTGRVSAALTPTTLSHFLPTGTRLITLFDTQPLFSVYNQYVSTKKIPDGAVAPLETQNATSISVHDGITHTTQTITDTHGTITTTARIEGSWTTQASINEAYTLALEQGGLWVSTTPHIIVLDENNKKYLDTSIIVYYTGGEQIGTTFVPPYSIQPKYPKDSLNAYHGFVLSAQLAEGVVHKQLPKTVILSHDEDVDGLLIADLLTLLGANSELSLDVYAVSSLGDNTPRLRAAWSELKNNGISTDHVKVVSLAAGNANTVYKEPVSPEQDVFFWVTAYRSLLTNNIGSYRASSNVIIEADVDSRPSSYAAADCVTTRAMVIDTNSLGKPKLEHRVRDQVVCGTSVAAPYLAVEAIGKLDSTQAKTVSDVLTDTAELAYAYVVTELENVQQSAVFTDTAFTSLLNAVFPGNNIPNDAVIYVSANWKSAVGEYAKDTGIMPLLDVSWDNLNQKAEQEGDQLVFEGQTVAISKLAQEAQHKLYTNILTFYYLDNQGKSIKIEGSTNPAVKAYLKGVSHHLVLGRMKVQLVRTISRVAPHSYSSPAQIKEETTMFLEIGGLFTAFDPKFTPPPTEVNMNVFLPLIQK
jgi:hypothetical protein